MTGFGATTDDFIERMDIALNQTDKEKFNLIRLTNIAFDAVELVMDQCKEKFVDHIFEMDKEDLEKVVEHSVFMTIYLQLIERYADQLEERKDNDGYRIVE